MSLARPWLARSRATLEPSRFQCRAQKTAALLLMSSANFVLATVSFILFYITLLFNICAPDPSQAAGPATQISLDAALEVLQGNLPALAGVVRNTIGRRTAAEIRLDGATRVRWGIQAQIHSLRLLHRTALMEELTAAHAVIAEGGRINPFEDPAADYLPLRDDHWDFSARDEAALIQQLRDLDNSQRATQNLAGELGRAASEEARDFSEEEDEDEELE